MLSSKTRGASGSGSRAGSAAATARAGGLVCGVLYAAALGRSVVLLVPVALVVACGSEPVWQSPPPNLSGVYDLVSFSLKDGPTYAAPEASGTLKLSQDYTEDPDEATGDMSAEVMVASLDRPIEVEYQGKYANRNDGTWSQRGVVAVAQGTYTFGLSVEVPDYMLTITITEPLAAVSTYVWRLR